MASKRLCYTCGAEYEYCTRCSAYADQPKWRWMWDTEECKNLYDAISGYNMGIKTSEDIKEVINKYDITDYSKYNEKIESLLNDLFGTSYSYGKKFNKKNKKKEMDIELKQEDKVEDGVETPVTVEDTLSSILDLEGISEE